MKNVNNLGKRFLALLIAVVMIVGLVPADITVAAEESAASVTLLTLAVTKTEVKGEPKKDPETDDPVVDPETNEPVLEDSTYDYSAAVTFLGNSAADAEILWKVDDGEYSKDTKVIGLGEQNVVTAKVTYKGLELEVKAEVEENTGAITASVGSVPEQTKYTQVKLNGVAPAYQPQGYIWKFEATSSSIDENKYVIANAAEEVTLGNYVLYDESDASVSGYSLAVTAKVVEPTFTVDYNGFDFDKWYTAPQNITVNATANAELMSGDIAVNLPAVVKDGDGVTPAWTRDGKTWSATIEGVSKIQVGSDAEQVLNIDAVKPDISIVSSYVDNGKTTVNVQYTVGASGVASAALINGEKEFAIAEKLTVTDGSSTTVQIVLDEVVEGELTATLINGAGAPAPSSGSTAIVPAMVVTGPTESTIVGEHNGVTYLPDGATLTYNVENATSFTVENPIVDKADINVDGKQVVLTLKSVAVGTRADIGKINLTIKDDLGRTVINEGTKAYAVDRHAPVIGETAITDGYKNQNQEYKFTVTDEYMGVSGLTLTYVINGTEMTVAADEWKSNTNQTTFEYTLVVTDGQTLTKVELNAKDMSGNDSSKTWTPDVTVDTTKPQVTIKASENVKYFAKLGDEYFAVLEPVNNDADPEGKEKVTLTIEVVDANFDGAAYDFTNVEGNKWTKTINSAEVANHQTALFSGGFQVIDKAGWVADAPSAIVITSDAAAEENKFMSTVSLAPDPNGLYKFDIHVDRRAPGNTDTEESELANAPVVTMTPSIANVTTVGEENRPLYVEKFSLSLNISDLSKKETEEDPDNNAYFDQDDLQFTVTVSDGLGGSFLSATNDVKLSDDGKTVTGNIYIHTAGNNETNSAVLTFTISDRVGNTYSYVMPFALDNLAPRIEVTYDNNNVINGKYFDAVRNAKIVVTDLNAVLSNTVITSSVTATEWTNGTEANSHVATCAFGEGDHTFAIASTDIGGNATTNDAVVYNTAAPCAFTVDLTNPHFTVTKTVAEGARYVQEDGAIEYYNGQVVYTIKADDTNFGTASYQYSYIDTSNKLVESEAIALENGKEATIKINNGEVLVGITMTATDMAMRNASVAADLKSDVPFAYDEENNNWSYTGKQIAVDSTPAAVTLKKDVTEGEWIQSYEDYDYYNAPLTYSIDIQDRFLTDLEKSSVKLVVEYMDSTKNFTRTIGDFTKRELEDAQVVYSTKFEVLDGQGMTNMTIQVIDNAGNATAVIDVIEDAKMTTFAFDKETQANNYLGSTAVVDTTTPKATLSIDGNVESFYTYKGVAYVKLADPASGLSGILAGEKAETVSLTINVMDKNVTLNAKNEFSVKNNTSNDATNWTGKELKNADTTLTYFDKITVEADKTGYFTFDLTVYDLAGNAITDNDITVTAINGTVPNNLKEMVKTDEGKFGTVISVDRRRPSTVTGDNNAPVITIQPSINFTTSNNDKELYASAFNFALTVTDGADNESNSGLNSVDWVIEDPVGFVAPANVVNAQESGTYTQTFSIPVTLAQAAGESNSVKLTITATDNVGNSTTYVKEFAVDNLAPRVTVSYDNNSVLNAKYFKADRIASIRVEDINFNAATTPITTEVTPSAWTQAGDVYTATCAYTADGEYTFDMSATDKAANVSEIDFTNGGRNAAPKEFVIDKTAPVINVTYNPSSPIGTDPEGVQYYDQELDVTVTITEVNFNASEVQAEMGPRNTLNFWGNSGERHTASTTYTEGNNYSFNIQYTDLAGNAATPYSSATFSVDTHAPTIVISEGDLTTDALNIVQGDLVLGFTINDEQENLKDYSVKVTHLNNEFQETEISGAEYFVVNETNNRTTIYVDFTSIEALKENDGTYNVQISASDYAGHYVTLHPELNFSLNRFGSTFMTDDEFTANFLTPSTDGTVYQSNVSNKLVIKEINPNKVWQDDTKKVEGSVITIAVNGQSIVLEKDVDYTVTLSEEGAGSNKWYVYTYEIDPSNFAEGEEMVDGNYTILLYGVDEAGNKNTNESNEYGSVQKDSEGNYSGKIVFTLDHKAPVITTYGIESGDSIDAESKQLNISLSDNTPAGVKVLVNGVEVVLSETMEGLADNALWLAYNEATGEYVLNIPESNEKREIVIITTDAAGNASEQVIEDVLITSNWFIRAINNPVIVGGTCTGIVGLVAFIIFLLKKKKNKEEQPA